MLDRCLDEAGLDRQRCYVTNAVKHFKFTPRGKRRLHAKPNAGEIRRCAWWLGAEINILQPKLVVTLGKRALCTARAEGEADARARPYPASGKPSTYPGHHPPLLSLAHPRRGGAAPAAPGFRVRSAQGGGVSVPVKADSQP
ncbi:uracil-DNA glycosylase family protein [Rhizobium beringeri]